MLVTWGCFGLANLATYKYLQYWIGSQEDQLKGDKYKIAFGHYKNNCAKLLQYIRQNWLYLERNLAREQRSNGLIILEAYFGLDEHIYHIDSKLLIYKTPQTIKEYYEAQVVPLKKFLTTKISNSQLVLRRSEFFQTSRILFNPCVSKAASTLIYVRYSYGGLEKTLIYDFSRETLTIPHDVVRQR